MTDSNIISWLIALSFVGLVGFMIVVVVRACSERSRCVSSGGRVEHYNFRTILMPTSCGDNCTFLMPVETSDWRCVGAPAEVSR